MSEYLSVDVLLADIRLRLDTDRSNGVLIVEGPDDKRAFARHVVESAHVFPCAGRKRLLKVYANTTDEDKRRMLFLTDCDYEVRRGILRGSSSLIITRGTDLEYDLIDLGLLQSVIEEVVPRALSGKRSAVHITEIVLKEARSFSLPLGRMRMASQPYGIPLQLEDIRHRRYWDKNKRTVNENALIDAYYAKLSGAISSLAEWRNLVTSTPDDDRMCHGKDLVRSIHFILKTHYGLPDDVSATTIGRLLRANLWISDLERWEVGQRIRRWQDTTGRRILKHKW